MKKNAPTLSSQDSVVLKVSDLVERVKTTNPQLLANLNEKKVINIARSVIQQLSLGVESTQEGLVKVPGFGSFVVKQVPKKGDVDPDHLVRRVVFRPAKQKVRT